MVMRRVREWFADRFRWAQYPKQQFIPRVAPPSSALTTENSMLLFVIALMMGVPAVLLLSAGIGLLVLLLVPR